MSKTSITIEFPNPEAARVALGRMIGADNVTVTVVALPDVQQTATTSGGASKDVIEKIRKPRSDAGQPRGPNARTATPPAEPPANSAVAAGPAPTVADARAAMKRINDTKGLGMDACMGHLKEFGVQKISDLKPEQFALFIKQADDKIAEAGK